MLVAPVYLHATAMMLARSGVPLAARLTCAFLALQLWAGIPAAVACPVSCGTCGIGLCYDNDKFKSCKLTTYSNDEVDEEK